MFFPVRGNTAVDFAAKLVPNALRITILSQQANKRPPKYPLLPRFDYVFPEPVRGN
jgi:hypothetical protein